MKGLILKFHYWVNSNKVLQVKTYWILKFYMNYNKSNSNPSSHDKANPLFLQSRLIKK